jgi:hypothetical protein
MLQYIRRLNAEMCKIFRQHHQLRTGIDRVRDETLCLNQIGADIRTRGHLYGSGDTGIHY